MQGVLNRPLFTRVYDTLDEFVPDPGTAYVFGTSGEDRSAHSVAWEQRAATTQFLRITGQGQSEFQIDLGNGVETLALRSSRQLTDLFSRIGVRRVYLDITGLAHHVWAPLIRAARTNGTELSVVYVEPKSYTLNSAPTEGEIFDLSKKIEGISPLPGFASLSSKPESFVFVPLLGFEGTRLSFLLEQVQPDGNKIAPVIGVPGFEAEYPFYTFLGNRAALSESRAWRNAFFARANCPFSLFYTLSDIGDRWPESRLKIAPIGTKPHAIGAVVFSLSNPHRVELVYDHPVRSDKRSSGASRTLVYDLWFLPSWQTNS
jgi:hypothetical protein